jgi:hypothetical protein
MKKGLAFIIVVFVLAGALMGLTGCAIGPDNVTFNVQISGPPGAEFTGNCTYEVKDLIGSRTVEAEVQGEFTNETPVLEYEIRGTEISGTIINETPDKPITIVLFKDNIEVKRTDGLGEGEANLSWYPPITVNIATQEAQGYQYETAGSPSNLIEIGSFTQEETNKINGLIEKIAPETKQQFEERYKNLVAVVEDSRYAVRSDPFWKVTEPYQQLLKLYDDKGDTILPLIFQKIEKSDTLMNYALGDLMADIALKKHQDVLERINYENQHGRYTEGGLYILPDSATTMRLAKALLAEL